MAFRSRGTPQITPIATNTTTIAISTTSTADVVSTGPMSTFCGDSRSAMKNSRI